MKHQLQPDNTDTRPRTRSGVIKASKTTRVRDHESRSRSEPKAFSKSNARKAVERASGALKDTEQRTVGRTRTASEDRKTQDERQSRRRQATYSRENTAEKPVRSQAQRPQQDPPEQPPQAEVSADTTKWYQSKWIKYGSMAVLMALMVAVAFAKPIDKSSESQIDSALTRALIGFGIARTLNGVISVAQGTEFAVQPAGVGVNFSPGEILDPVNDLVERFSWVMLVATSSLGVQKILLEVSSWIGISFMLAGAAVFWLLTRMQSGAASSVAKFASRVLLVMLLLRFLIPLGSIANDWVYRQFLEPRFETSSQQLEVASERIREISTRQSNPPQESSSLRQKAKNIYQSMTSKFDFDGMLQDYKRSAEDVSEHAVNLIVVFLLQTILFPLIFLYVVYRAFRYLLLPPSGA